eukprot:7177533-Prymnesium_polylepis.1
MISRGHRYAAAGNHYLGRPTDKGQVLQIGHTDGNAGAVPSQRALVLVRSRRNRELLIFGHVPRPLAPHWGVGKERTTTTPMTTPSTTTLSAFPALHQGFRVDVSTLLAHPVKPY